MKVSALMFALGIRVFAACAVLVAMFAAELVPAHAQETIVVAQQQQRTNPIASFFRALFGGLRRQPQRLAPPPTSTERIQPRRTGGTTERSSPAAPPQPAAVAKDPDAQRVAVFGDFFASGLAEGLKEEFAESPMVAIDVKSDPSSGLVRQDYFDWPAAIRDYLAEPDRRVDVAVVMIGANDRQPLSDASGEQEPRSEAWQKLYIARIDQIIDLLQTRSIPVYWVGLPPVQSPRMTQDYAYFNDLYRERAYRTGSGFVDIWNAFTDENGKYAVYGPDLNGENRQLRRDDGLHFTAAGNRKLAHFVTRDIRHDLGVDGDTLVALPQGPVGPRPFVPGEEEQETGIGQVVTLTGGVSSGAGALAGGVEPTPQPPDDSAYYDVILLGRSPEPRPGRTDDFTWPRRPRGEDAQRDDAAPPRAGG